MEDNKDKQQMEQKIPEQETKEDKVKEASGIKETGESGKVESGKVKTETKHTMNKMRDIRIEKLTLNIGVGKNEDLLKKGMKLLQKLSPVRPIKTKTQKRIPGWGLRPGLAIGCKVTIRKGCKDLLKRLLVAKDNVLKEINFDKNGNFSFGISEYINIEGLDYDPDLKIMGLEVAVTLERPGFRVKKRKIKQTKVGKNHLIVKEDAIQFMKNLGIEVQ